MSNRSRRGASRFSPLGLSVLLVSASLGGASASGGPQYVALRAKRHCDTKLAYATLLENPSDYAGRVIELRGKISGTVETADGLSVLLGLGKNDSLSLDIPKGEAALLRDYVNPTVRVLAQVEEGSSGNTVALKVLALAQDSDVKAIEAQEAARTARRQAASRGWTQNVSAPSRTSLSARGSFTRALTGAASADAERWAQYYDQNLTPRVKPLFIPYYRFIAGQNRKLGGDQVGLITASLLHFADANNVDPRLVVAMIIAESGFDPNSTSRSGAMGLGQLMPETARDLGIDNAYDPVKNLQGSIAYLSSRLNNFGYRFQDGSVSFEHAALALAAYNAGMGAVKKYKGIPPYRETQAYVNRVVSTYRQLCGGE